jgi:hypothetical protein
MYHAMMTFLQQNLSVLPERSTFADHARLTRQLLEAGTNETLPEAYSLYESEVGDIALVYENEFALHSLQGAQREAADTVEKELKRSRYSINIIFGMGMGYMLQHTVQQLRACGSQAKVVLFETDMDFLRFTLSQVNLSEVLDYEHLYIFTEREQLWQFAESSLVEGDGIGMMVTPGAMLAFNKTLKPILEKLVLHAENAIRNAQLLQRRAKLWSVEFMKNIPVLPSLHDVHALAGCLKGKTALMCGSGPSLSDVLPHIPPVRDKLIICAVSGAVKILLKHGITPDFVMGMDYYGPAKQMEGLNTPLQNSHIISGPSADHFMLSEPCKSRWLACLKYNEQYTYLMDAMLNDTVDRYHTGGTVAFFMLLIMVQMGVDRMILAGQDLALRGLQIYATGESHEVKCTLKTVEGWNGEELFTQDDYKHFKFHYDTIRSRVREHNPDFEIYNCSIGGAKIAEMENLPIETLLPRLNLNEPANLDAILNDAMKRDIELGDAAGRAQRLNDEIESLKTTSEKLLQQAERALNSLHKLKILKAHSWQDASERYSEDFNAFSETLEGNAFLQDNYYHEQLTIYQLYNEFAETEADHRHNFKLDETYLNTMADCLKKELIPALDGALEALGARYPDVVQLNGELEFTFNTDAIEHIMN